MFKSSAKYLRKNIINYVFIDCRTHPPNFWMWMFFQWSLNCEQKGIREQAIVSSFGIQKQAMSPFTKPRQKKTVLVWQHSLFTLHYIFYPLFFQVLWKNQFFYFLLFGHHFYMNHFSVNQWVSYTCAFLCSLCAFLCPPLCFSVSPPVRFGAQLRNPCCHFLNVFDLPR